MTVEEYFSTELIKFEDVRDMLNNSIDESNDYKFNSSSFIIEKWSHPFENLSPKQQSWATKILEHMAERRIEGRSF